MQKSTIGIRGATVERARRRGYSQAISDIIEAMEGNASYRVLGRLRDWRKKVNKWRKLANVAAAPNVSDELPPKLNFNRRLPAGNFREEPC